MTDSRRQGTRAGRPASEPAAPTAPDSNGGDQDPLARLAARNAGDLAAHHRRTIDRAVAATDDLERAAAFADTVGLDGLRAAIRAAEAANAERTARRGQAALAAFEQFRRAATGRDGRDTPSG